MGNSIDRTSVVTLQLGKKLGVALLHHLSKLIDSKTEIPLSVSFETLSTPAVTYGLGVCKNLSTFRREGYLLGKAYRRIFD